MGLFTPKISPQQLQVVNATLAQIQDSARLVNETVKPDVFFKRLNFLLDQCLLLQQYEKYKIFKGSTPTQDYNKIIQNMEATVDDFITRAISANQDKLNALKTEKAKRANYEKFVTSLVSAFDCANTFWTGNFSGIGNKPLPHYRGPLFTENNYRRVKSLYDGLPDEE